MSLKTFHLVFINACLLLALGLGAWSLANYAFHRDLSDLLFAAGWFVAGALLVLYERGVVRKFRHLGDL